ncbi:MAG: cyclase family protein [Thermoleophilia bacterium]|nr:cyclase family protein [Thermoleophilia bacterium]
MQIIDISVPIYTGMVFYPGDTGAVVEPVRRIAEGADSNISELRLGSHTGTHVDAPHHFENNRETVDRIPLEVLVGPARVVDLTGVEALISRENLIAAGADGAERLLMKTTNSGLWARPEFASDFVALAGDGADYLIQQGVKLVGIDYLSIEQFKPEEYYVHHALLGSGITVLEGTDLSEIEPGDYDLACLPLKVLDADGAPARAVLIRR